MRHLFILAALALGCGTLQPSVEPETDRREPASSRLEVPSNAPKPFKYQVRPGPDGTCGKYARVFNGGCWVRIEVPLEECREQERKDMSYLVHEGTCYYAHYWLPPEREPTSSLERPASQG